MVKVCVCVCEVFADLSISPAFDFVPQEVFMEFSKSLPCVLARSILQVGTLLIQVGTALCYR